MNLMKDISKKLDIKLEEEGFYIKYNKDNFYMNDEGSKATFYFTEAGLFTDDILYPNMNTDIILSDLLTDFAIIEKKPWMPKKDERYYCLDKHGHISWHCWSADEIDIALYAFGNCFPSEEKANRHKDKIIKKINEIHYGIERKQNI